MEKGAFEGPAVCASRDEVVQALNEIKTGKTPEPLVLSLKLISVSREVGIQVTAEICLSPRWI